MQQKAEGELVSVETIEQELTLLVRGAQKVHLRGGIERPPRPRLGTLWSGRTAPDCLRQIGKPWLKWVTSTERKRAEAEATRDPPSCFMSASMKSLRPSVRTTLAARS